MSSRARAPRARAPRRAPAPVVVAPKKKKGGLFKKLGSALLKVAKPVAKESIEKTSGERKFSEVVVPKPAPAKGMELKVNANMKNRAPQSIHKEKLKVKAKYDSEAFDKRVMEMYPGRTLEKATEKYYNVKRRQDKRGEREVERDWQSRVGGSNSKNKDSACRTC